MSGSPASVRLYVSVVEGNGYHLFCKGALNGFPARFLLDTGASLSVADTFFVMSQPAYAAKKFPLTNNASGIAGESLKVQSFIPEKLKLGRISVRMPVMAMMDLHHVNSLYNKFKLPPVQGIIGGDLLMACRARIDYHPKEPMLRLYLPADQKP